MSVLILPWRPKQKIKSDTPLACPWCQGHYGERYDVKKQVWKEDRWVNPVRLRYVCKHCKRGTIVDFS